jgi:hypothetical protein
MNLDVLKKHAWKSLVVTLGCLSVAIAGMISQSSLTHQVKDASFSLWLTIARWGFLGVVMALVRPLPRHEYPHPWRRALYAAWCVWGITFAMDVCLLMIGIQLDVSSDYLGARYDVPLRMLRLARMAGQTIPVLVILVAEIQHVYGTLTFSHDDHENTIQKMISLWEKKKNVHTGLADIIVYLQPVLLTIGVITLPLLLVLGAFVHKEIVWLLPIGADTTILGCVGMMIMHHRRKEYVQSLPWWILVVSMVGGLCMGGYAFGGPWMPPPWIGEYMHPHRTVLRNVHIVSILLSIVWITVHMMIKKRGR